MLLYGETGWRLRRFAAVLATVTFGWAALVATAGADPRHYEQVSPADKGGGDIVADATGDTNVAAKLGDAVTFTSRSPFGDEVGSGVDGQTTYVARRGEAGWLSHAVTPTGRPDAIQVLFLMTKIETFSEDLTRGIVWGYDLPGGGGTPDRANIYEEDVSTRGLQALTLSQSPLFAGEFLPVNEVDWGVSADAQHVALVASSAQMLPNAAPNAPNVYQWDAGRGLSLAGILPDGSVPTTGSDIQPNNYRASMSADGSRLVFTAVPNDDPNGDPELYMRIDGRMTVPISTPSGSSAFSTNVALQAVTPDGRNVFFVTNSPLVPEDTNSGPDLYRWTDSGDSAHDGTLTAITTAGGFSLWPVQPTGVIGASDDGTRVYYQSLSGGLVVWDNGTARVVGNGVFPDSTISIAAIASRPGLGRVTPDGMWLAFVSNGTFRNDGIHGLAPDVAGTRDPITNGHYEMYVYSLRDDRLTCVSCSSGGATSDVAVSPDVTSGSPALFGTALRPNFLSDNGQVFFSTRDSLLPEDVNGVEDVYEYDGSSGMLRLVSTGTGKAPTSFANAGANGGDVFILTRQQLVSGDRDDLVDLYDATTRPPLATSQQPPATDCQGDTCQPPPSASPPEDLIGSLSLDGGGNSSSTGKLLTIPGRVTVRGPVASLRVRLGAAGTLSWRGSGVPLGSAKPRSGAFTIRVRLNRRARAQLTTKGRYVTRVRLTLVLSDGTRVSGIVRVTFRAAAKKGR